MQSQHCASSVNNWELLEIKDKDVKVRENALKPKWGKWTQTFSLNPGQLLHNGRRSNLIGCSFSFFPFPWLGPTLSCRGSPPPFLLRKRDSLSLLGRPPPIWSLNRAELSWWSQFMLDPSSPTDPHHGRQAARTDGSADRGHAHPNLQRWVQGHPDRSRSDGGYDCQNFWQGFGLFLSVF